MLSKSLFVIFAALPYHAAAQNVRVVRFSESKPFTMGEVTARRIIHPDLGAKKTTLNFSQSKPGAEFAQHVHDYSDDTILVLQGEVNLRQADSLRLFKAGECAFVPTGQIHGTITAGNASQISDGAAAVVVASEEAAARLHLQPIASIEAYGMAAGAYSSLQTVPALAIEAALKRAGLDVGDLGLVEINEAFAAVAIHASRMLGIGDDIVNVNGGAIALGHPIGASGARLVLTLAMEMRRRGVDVGAAALCGGGGQGDALIVRRM
jgi:acetyl-CoA acetyltransferase family protein